MPIFHSTLHFHFFICSSMHMKQLYFFIPLACMTQEFHEIINCKVSHCQMSKSETQFLLFLVTANYKNCFEQNGWTEEAIAQDSDVHKTWNEDVSPPQSGSDTEGDDRTETDCTQCTDSTQSQHSALVTQVVLLGVPVGSDQMRHTA
jgi:hypothetical protein